MPRLVSATILPETDLAGQIQVELTWEKPAIALKDWKALHAALCDRHMPVTLRTEVRTYPTHEMANRAIDQLSTGAAA